MTPDEPSCDWGVSEPGKLLDLLFFAYGTEEEIRRITQSLSLEWDSAPQRCTIRELWTWALGKTAAVDRVLDLIAVVLHDAGSSHFHAPLRQLLGKRLGEVNARIVLTHGLPPEPAARKAIVESIVEAEPLEGDAPGELQSITAISVGFLNPAAKMQAIHDFQNRTAMISVQGQPRGTGFLVGDDLLLTAAHVFDPRRWPPNPLPKGAEAVFDFLASNRSLAETGIRVPITDYVTGSLPTDAEAGDTVGANWDAPADRLDFALLKLSQTVPDPSDADPNYARGFYRLYDDDYKFVDGMVYMIIQAALGGVLSYSEFGGPALSVSSGGTRFRYGGNAFNGSSGSAVVDNRGRLVGLHHWGGKKINQGVPISVIARTLLNGEHAGLFKTGGPIAPSVASLRVDPFTATTVLGRPFVNRSNLRATIRGMAERTDAMRVLVVNGERGTGVSYSYVLASHIAEMSTQCATLTTVASAGLAALRLDLRTYYEAYGVDRVCSELVMNLFESLGITTERSDHVAQEAREILSVTNKIGKALRDSDKQWWLFFDSIDSTLAVQQGGVAELIHALVGLASDPQISLRIVLAGSAADDFADEYTDGWVERDTTIGLSRGDVDAWLRLRAQEANRNIDDAALDGKLTELFPTGPLPEPRRLAPKLPRLFEEVTQR